MTFGNVQAQDSTQAAAPATEQVADTTATEATTDEATATTDEATAAEEVTFTQSMKNVSLKEIQFGCLQYYCV